jgi:hypothetical protein
MSTRDHQITAIAEAFGEVMRQWLTPAEFTEMKRRNETEAAYAGGACASHDFCDANMAMAEAFDHVMGRQPTSDEGDVAQSEADCALWNDAWNLSRKLYLGTQS